MDNRNQKTPYAIIWHRNDLRLDDNPAVDSAVRTGQPVCAVYVLDPNLFATTDYGFRRMGARRLQFLLDSLADLKQHYQELGHDLYIATNDVATAFGELLAKLPMHSLHYCMAKTTYERRDECALRAVLPNELTLVPSRGDTLLNIERDVFEKNVPTRTFTRFRKAVEKSLNLRDPVNAPIELNSHPLDCSVPVKASHYGYQRNESDIRSPIRELEPGESGARRQLDRYLWQTEAVTHYKETRNGMLNWEESSRLSPYLAHGCLSPIRAVEQLMLFEERRVQNESTYWLFFELLWREYFHVLALHFGDKLFYRSGTHDVYKNWRRTRRVFDAWCEGRTGRPIVDANMRELNATGYMSNRGRQLVASYLAKELGIDWRLGAEWFEHHLIDYDPCVNWGNWQYQAGVGVDTRDRRFNLVSQSERYDPDCVYVRRWLNDAAAYTNAELFRLNGG